MFHIFVITHFKHRVIKTRERKTVTEKYHCNNLNIRGEFGKPAVSKLEIFKTINFISDARNFILDVDKSPESISKQKLVNRL